MREILFRAKAINRDSIDSRCRRTDYKNGDWVYGLITKLHDEISMLKAISKSSATSMTIQN